MYLIPFPTILKHTFLISHLKKGQIPPPEIALLGPLSGPAPYELGLAKVQLWNSGKTEDKSFNKKVEGIPERGRGLKGGS